MAGPPKWSELPDKINLGESGKACRRPVLNLVVLDFVSDAVATDIAMLKEKLNEKTK